MISSLRGKLIFKKNHEVILESYGVGYQIFVSKKLSESLSSINDEYFIFTHLDVKENSMQLYGFCDEKEKEIFKMLLSVSGIGPKIAHTIVANLTFDEILSFISDKSYSSRIRIPGIGAKKLELISMSLKDKVFKIDKDTGKGAFDVPDEISGDNIRYEALNALINLGYPRSDAEKLIREALKKDNTKINSTEELIRKALDVIS
ncbi:MAG: Holliday junction branch migration protein RuvA [Bacteroidetes bacterium]|nr:Holliday junction branch migration protein RuvA [Bacteroidota bacterium]